MSNINEQDTLTLSAHDVHNSKMSIRVNGNAFSTSQQGWRGELRRLVNMGEVDSIEFDAIVFKQGPNSNFFAFHDHELSSFAETFPTQPFLRDHDTENIDSRDGIILTSTNKDGSFVQRIELTTERGIRSFAEGQIDRFSIGFGFESATCTLCENDFFNGFACPHMIGVTYDNGTCSVLFNNPRGVETSAVNIPAVPGTQVLATMKQQLLIKSEEIPMNEEKDQLIDDQEEAVQAANDVVEQSELERKLARLAHNMTPYILALISSKPELQERFAKAFYLDDIDRRIGEAEMALSSLNDRIKELNEKVAAATLAQNDVFEVADAQVSFGRWDGYNSNQPKTDAPVHVREPNIAAGSMSDGEQKTFNKLPETEQGKINRRQRSGSTILGYWNGG